MHPARFTPLAEDDLREAFEYYERKRPELGIEFMGKVRETVDRIEQNPLIFPIILDGVRRANVSRFPYGVWYRVEPDESIIIACLSHSREHGLAVKRARMLSSSGEE